MESEQISSAKKNILLQREELLAYLLEEEGAALSQEHKISPRAEKSDTLLSFAQQRLWFFDQFDMENPLYNVPVACRLSGELQRTVLERSLNEIVRRHEILRTTFDMLDDQPVQVVASSLDVPLQALDLRALPENMREPEMLKTLKEETRRGFDLAHGPLIRAHLLQLAEREYVLLLVCHHIVIDDWSIRIILREFIDIYASFSNGALSSLPDLPIQYADYALWQRNWMLGERLQQELSYWSKQLADLPRSQVPTDHPHPPVQTYRGGYVHFALSQDLTDQLKMLSQREGVTLFMILLAAFQILLARYSQQKDIVVGTTIANRSQAEVENLIGFFVNTLALRTNLAGNPTCREMLARVRKTTLDAYTHQEVPFEKVVEALQPERDYNYASLFQTMLVLHNALLETRVLSDLTLQPLIVDRDTSELDLGLDFFDTEHGLMGKAEYSADLFEPTTIARMIDHLRVILQAMVVDPAQHIDTLPLLTEQERRQILIEWNGDEADYPSHLCAHEEIERQVERTPDAIAAVFKHQRLTFRELNERANQLAHYLRSRGVGPEVPVGICVEHSLETLVSMLGVIKAGGAYVPFDPNYPQDRLDFMIDDTRIAVLVTQQQFVEKFQACEASLVCIDSEQQAIARCSTKNVQSGVVPGNLIYIIYTSGSTGLPKGVMITHAHLMNMFYVWNAAYHLQSVLQAHLQMSSFSVDLFICDAIQTLCTGARLVMCSQDDVLMPERLYALMRQERVNSGEFVPAVLKGLVDYLEETGQSLAFMDIIVAGADSWHARDYQTVRRLGGTRTRVINGYGSTEVTIDSTYFEGGEDYTRTDGVVPLGRPFPDTEVYILDAAMQPVPVGIAGEIYIGGKRPGRGYLNRPELTAERFVPHPFSRIPGSRLYRMGDLGRYRPDGAIEFMGRADYQVKIRGFRIELGEIEAALKDLSTVQEAVVLVYENNRPEDKRLVAYVVAREEVPDHANELRRALQEKLPYYMVPADFFFLEEIPLNSTGKIDRRALPEPDMSEFMNSASYVAPRNPFEEIVADIWRDVLGVKQVGAYDNFFERGGHSLLATQVISRLQQIFNIEFPLRTLFEFPSVAEIAQHVQKGQSMVQLPLTARDYGTGEQLPLSSAQQRLWFLDQLEPDNAFYSMADALHMRGVLHQQALEQGINEIVQRHAVLRTTFPANEGHPHQVIAPSLYLALSLVNLSDWPPAVREEEARRVVMLEMQQPFDLAQGPLLRTTLVRLAEQEHVLIVSMHHIVADGWSMGIFIRELQSLYAAYTAGQPARLAPLPIQYVDYAYWQSQWLQEELLQSQQAYWQQTLAGAPALLQLPADRPRPSVQSYRGSSLAFELSIELTRNLKKISQRNGVTLFMLLLAAFQMLLARYSGQEDIVVGTPIANRTRMEIEGLIGCFVNTLALRVDLSGNPTVQQVLQQVSEACLGAYAHQDLPFEQVVNALQPERSLSQNPLFQVMFTLEEEQTLTKLLTGLITNSWVAEQNLTHTTTKFDLSLSLAESEHRLVGVLEYSTDLFDQRTIIQMQKHLEVLLQSIVRNMEQRLSNIALLTEKELHQICIEWNATSVAYPKKRCIHEDIEAQARRTPDQWAVVYEQEHLTYQALNEQANQLAHYLQTLGVGPDVYVGFCMERSLEMVVVLLGILKAGGAYIPLDPGYPQDRLAFLLDDADIHLILSHSTLLEKLPDLESARGQVQVCCIDHCWSEIATFPQYAPETTLTTENLAYIIYTSGSTGKPKGVMNTHEAIYNRLLWMQDAYPLAATDRVLQKTPLSFDVSVWEVFWPLMTGARLIVARPDAHRDSSYLVDLICKQQITTLHFVPSMLQVFVEEPGLDSCQDLRRVFCSGEVLPFDLQQRFFEHCSAELCNLYGPTEAAVDVSFWVCQRESEKKIVPIGYPIANMQLFVLDPYLHPVPVGSLGELYLGGVGLARGYVRRPDLTAERFIPNPFSQQPGARLYKTGDLVRYLPDGSIDFVGRLDHQVKMRGFRIELGEVEVALSQHPGVRIAVVVLLTDQQRDNRLAAYVVPSATQVSLSAGDLRDYLKKKVPEYMIPATFLLLDDLPLNANGKVDRKRLPPINQERSGLENAFVAPRTLAEELVAASWSEVLGLEQIGVYDNYFALGGHSLLATRILARLGGIFQIDLPLRILFEATTIAELVEEIGQLAGGIDVMEMIAQTYKELELLPEDEIIAMLDAEHN